MTTRNINVKNEEIIAAPGRLGRIVIYLTFIFGFPVLLFIASCNTFKRQMQSIDETASDIDVQLKKRRDLLIKSLDAVKGIMKFEKETQIAITELRTRALNPTVISGKEFAETKSNLDEISHNINVQMEQYPDLKSAENVRELQEQAADTERNIAASRRFYNATVRNFNSRVITYPTSVVAYSLKLSTLFYFEASENDKKDVKIDL